MPGGAKPDSTLVASGGPTPYLFAPQDHLVAREQRVPGLVLCGQGLEVHVGGHQRLRSWRAHRRALGRGAQRNRGKADPYHGDNRKSDKKHYLSITLFPKIQGIP